MPKVRTRETETVRILLRGNKSEAMRKAGMTRGTFYNRVDHPGELKLSEIGPIAEANDLTDAEIAQIVRMWS